MTARHEAPDGKERLPLDRERILNEALVFIDAEGLAGFTMVRLAERLGFTDMALYSHVRNRDEVLEGVVDLLLSQAGGAQKRAPAEWSDALRELYRGLWQLFQRHPQVLPVLLSRPLTLPSMAACLGRSQGLLRSCGFSESSAQKALSSLTAYTLGFSCLACGGYLTINEVPPLAPPPPTRSRRRQDTACPGMAAGLDWQRLGERFEAGLEIVLAGVRQELGEGASVS